MDKKIWQPIDARNCGCDVSETCSLIRWPLIVPGRGLRYGSRDSLRHGALPVTVPANLLDFTLGHVPCDGFNERFSP